MRSLHDPKSYHNHREARFGVCLLGLLTLSLLAGCGGGGGGNGNSGGGTTTTGVIGTGGTSTGSSTSGSSTGTNTGGTNSVSVSGTTATGLTATLTEASSTVSVNGTLVYTLTLTNNTTADIPIQTTADTQANPPVLPTTPAAGLVIRNAGGTTTFEPIPGPAPVFTGTLKPGQSLTSTVTANGFTTAGTYSATATFSDDTTAAKSVGPLLVTAQ